MLAYPRDVIIHFLESNTAVKFWASIGEMKVISPMLYGTNSKEFALWTATPHLVKPQVATVSKVDGVFGHDSGLSSRWESWYRPLRIPWSINNFQLLRTMILFWILPLRNTPYFFCGCAFQTSSRNTTNTRPRINREVTFLTTPSIYQNYNGWRKPRTCLALGWRQPDQPGQSLQVSSFSSCLYSLFRSLSLFNRQHSTNSWRRVLTKVPIFIC